MIHEITNPFLFACGVPRSGTTLLQRMLDSHPDLAVVNDSHFIPRALELTGKSLVDQALAGQQIELTKDLIECVFNYHRFYRMEISEIDFRNVADASSSFQEFVSRLYDLFADNAGKKLAGEKTPDYCRRLGLMHGLFPDAKLIHLIRDGRNVALSLMQWSKPDKGPGKMALWDESPVAVCALWWQWLVMESRKQATMIKRSAYIEINYEQLTSNPIPTMHKVCNFLGIAYSPSMNEYHRGKSPSQGKLSAKSAWLAPQTGLRDWRKDMEQEQVELFEALASQALEELGYELRYRTISSRIRQQAKEYAIWWDQNFEPGQKRSKNARRKLVG